MDYLIDTLLQVTNYELGVVFPLKDDDHVDRTACWERPPKKYVLGDDVPWVRLNIAFFKIFTDRSINRRCKMIARYFSNLGRSHRGNLGNLLILSGRTGNKVVPCLTERKDKARTKYIFRIQSTESTCKIYA